MLLLPGWRSFWFAGLLMDCPGQELDGSWTLDVSKVRGSVRFLWKQGFSGSGIRDSDESTKLKLDRGWEESGIGQEVDEYKTESKV